MVNIHIREAEFKGKTITFYSAGYMLIRCVVFPCDSLEHYLSDADNLDSELRSKVLKWHERIHGYFSKSTRSKEEYKLGYLLFLSRPFFVDKPTIGFGIDNLVIDEIKKSSYKATKSKYLGGDYWTYEEYTLNRMDITFIDPASGKRVRGFFKFSSESNNKSWTHALNAEKGYHVDVILSKPSKNGPSLAEIYFLQNFHDQQVQKNT